MELLNTLYGVTKLQFIHPMGCIAGGIIIHPKLEYRYTPFLTVCLSRGEEMWNDS